MEPSISTSGAEVTLEILHIIIRIPETPFQIRKQLNRFLPLRIIGKRKLIDLAGILKRYEGEQGGLQMVFLPGKAAVSHSMPAFIKIQRSGSAASRGFQMLFPSLR